MRFCFLLPILLLLFTSVACSSPADSEGEGRAFESQYEIELRAFRIARDTLSETVLICATRPDLCGDMTSKRDRLMTRPEKLAVWSAWNTMMSSQAVLDGLRRKYSHFMDFEEKKQRDAAFDLAHAAFTAGYRYALEFIALADRNPAMDTILNDEVPELGIPAGTFKRFKFRFLNVAIASEFAALQALEKIYGTEKDTVLTLSMVEDRTVIWSMGKGEGYALTLKNALKVVKDAGLSAWFPIQKGVSGWMGDTKVHRKGVHLISHEQVKSMGRRLQPGDILFERHEWYLSNLGLPGFWTHVALYVGTSRERRDFFNDAQVKEWVKGQGVETGDLEGLLQQQYPEAYGVSTRNTADGLTPRILEAISEGVAFTSLEYTGASDSIGAIRPRLPKLDKARAIMRAFHYSGRPYDFDFDFRTDSALVCSELVQKAYEPSEGMKGLSFPLTEVLGRRVVAPNEIVRQFSRQFGTAAAQADFVLFLDGFEKEKRAVESTVSAFLESWLRPNWHILVQEAPVEKKKTR